MIRRSPTRIELKLEDLNDFEYIQKFEKKKNPSGGVVSCSADAQKLVRQERIGLGFRPIRASSNVGASQSSLTTPPLVGPIAAITSTDIPVNVTPTNAETFHDHNATINSTTDGLNLIPEEERIHATNNATNTSNMSLDESL